MNNFEEKSINFKKKTLAIAISYVVTGSLIPTNVSSRPPSDQDIYQAAQQGTTSILLMLDSSANMDDDIGTSKAPNGSLKNDYGADCLSDVASHSLKGITHTGAMISTAILDYVYQGDNAYPNNTSPKGAFGFDMPYCNPNLINAVDLTASSLGNWDGTSTYNTLDKVKAASVAKQTEFKNYIRNMRYSRMDRMKIAMTDLLSSNALTSNYVLGLGQFPSQSDYRNIIDINGDAYSNTNYYAISQAKRAAGYRLSASSNPTASQKLIYGQGYGDSKTGKILVGANTLTLSQRWLMRTGVAGLNSGMLSPLGSAYAEAGAYMLGSTTRPTTKSGVYATSLAGWYGVGATNSFEFSGFANSINSIKTNRDNSAGSRYTSPIPTGNNAECSNSGIFLLTNAAPTAAPANEVANVMKNAMPNFSSATTCPADGVIKRVSGTTDFGWTCMGEYAQKLVADSRKIRTAVAGFGNNFMPYLDNSKSQLLTDTTGKQRKYYKCNDLRVGQSYTVKGITVQVTQDTINACNLGEKSHTDLPDVGGYGNGGFYPIVSPEDLVEAVTNFADSLKSELPALSVGLPAIPVDTLNLTQQLPDVYYAQFQPDIDNSKGIWVGNIKKYKAIDNTFKDKNSWNVINAATGNLNSTTDFWSSSSDGGNATQGGVSAKLPVQTAVGRKLYTDRTVVGSIVSPITSANTDLTLIASNNTTATTNTAEILRASQDPDKGYLLNLLGFSVSTSTVPSSLTGTAQLRQMGATLNSTPLAFTTQSKIATRSSGSGATAVNVGDYVNRKDYVLFGTTQGLLQVVDASSGEEKFSFLPKEMIDRQKNGFVAKSLQTTSTVGEDLYQGIDGAWSVYANYIANNESNSLKADKLNVYGGLRRGGANYYGLDLKNIETGAPKFLFKTLGNTAVGANGLPTGSCSNSAPLNCMGQSWSKPAMGWIKWKGKPQLVMIVGGGYDPVYDSPTYKSNTTATKGNGVYIFAAESNTTENVTAGDLLWWGSSTANSTSATADNTTQKTANSDLKYSVVSEIKTVDRDSDGFIDNLYFGDLGGQVFRVDIDNIASISSTDATTATPARNFSVKRIVRIGNFITDTERASKAAPRFYNMPTFTVHSTGGLAGTNNASRYAVISIGSGDQSSPVSNGLTTTTGLPDRVYGIFDRDVGRTDLYSITDDNNITTGLFTGTATTTTMQDIAANLTPVQMLANMKLATTKGWFNTLSGSTFGRSGTNIDSNLSTGISRYKVLSKFSAIKGTLFTSYFDAADNGTSSSCSAGIKGRSYIKNYCLPFGNMNADGVNCGASTDGRSFSTATAIGSDVGAGVIPVIVGGMSTNNGSRIGPLSGKDGAVNAQYQTPLKLDPIKWSERNM